MQNRFLDIKWLLAFGIVIRIAFMLWGAPVYYGTPNYATNGGDTWSWVSSMQNLVHTGTYTADPNYEDGKFFRPPGYAFFLLIFYLLSGFKLQLAFTLAAYAQLILDTISIYLIYKIANTLSNNKSLSLLCAFIYCIYPFSLVWTPALYAEAPSLFFMFSTLYLIVRKKGKYNMVLSGICMGITVLLRLQTIFLVPAIAFYFWKKEGELKKIFQQKYLIFFLAFGFMYGSWPLRNLCYGKFIPAEEIVNDKHFSEDFVSFMFYIWSVKTDHRPQYDQIIHGEKVEWPKAAYLQTGDSATLVRISELCFRCGRGFSHFKASAGLISKPITEYNSCTKEIANTFDRLRVEQMKNNSFHYFIVVPLGNLKKAFFKSTLYDDKGALVKIVTTLLFSIRTLFILLGILGIWLNKRLQYFPNDFMYLCLFYFIIWYFTLCFGYRNIEIRYFLPVDVLLLIPATIPIFSLYNKFKSKKVLQ